MTSTDPEISPAPPIISESGEPNAVATRYHHLDAVRAFALLLGVLFHAAESFGPDNHYWAIVDCSPSQVLEDVRFACHSFRMELFFLIAGFFARLLVEKRGESAFVGNRLQRILVPLVLGWFLLYPMLAVIWIAGGVLTAMTASGSALPAAGGSSPIPEIRFDLTHLWFLHQLLVVYALFLLLRRAWLRMDSSGRKAGLLDATFARAFRWPVTWLALALAAFPQLLTMRSWGVDTPKDSLLPHWPTTLLFGFCFAVGWLLHRQPGLLQPLARRWPLHLALGIVSWHAFGFLDYAAIRSMGPAEQWNARLVFTALYAVMMWSFVLGFLGLFTRFFTEPNRWTRYLSDASYWIYLAHLPIVVALQVMLGRVPLPWQIKYPLIVVAAGCFLVLSYHYLVRGTFIGKQLNGQKYPVVWPWRAER